MGTMTVKAVNVELISSSENIKISKTTINSMASQERSITIHDVSGTMMVNGFSNVLTSTTLNSNHNGLILVSNTITLTLPDPSTVMGIMYTIKKISSLAKTVSISGIVDGEVNPQLLEQNSYITIISNGNAWYKVAESNTTATSAENQIYIGNTLGMTFRYIPAGTFVMGSPSDELGRNSDETQYTVTLSEPYYIQTTEVTQGQWKTVMGNNPSSFGSCGLSCPVEYISWDDTKTFIATLNAMGEGAYTLPTEAQWEYAARAGSDKAFANGGISDIITDTNLDRMAWYANNSNSTSHAIAQKQANAWGLFDMHGNVWEWCGNWYGTYPTTSVANPIGPLTGSEKALRGGGWNYNSGYCRSAKRSKIGTDYRHADIGLRLLKIINP